MSALYFVLDVNYQFEARVSEFDAVHVQYCTLSQLLGGGDWVSTSGRHQIGRIQQAENKMTTSVG